MNDGPPRRARSSPVAEPWAARISVGAALALAVVSVLVAIWIVTAGDDRGGDEPERGAWEGDFDTCDASQYSAQFAEHTESSPHDADGADIQFVEAPRRTDSGCAARFYVHPEDAPIPPGHRDRAELALSPAEFRGTEGAENWYGWSTYLPADLNPPSSGTSIIWQVHAAGGSTGVPPVRVQIDAARDVTISITGEGWQGPAFIDTHTLVRAAKEDAWYDFVLHIRWSADEDVGFYEIWAGEEGTLSARSPSVPRTSHMTRFSEYPNRLQIGFYKERTPGLRSTIFHDEVRRGDSFYAVAPTGTPTPAP
jgi:hypothetical protein